MYLSQLILNPRHRAARRDLANPYDMHRTLMAAFPAKLPEDERILFRVDTDSRTGVPSVLVQSHTMPDWTALENQGGYLLPESRWSRRVAANPAIKTYDLGPVAGQTLAFRLRANPTVKRRRECADGKLRPVRDPLYREHEQRDWLSRKGEQNGFRLLQVTVLQEGNQLAWKPRAGGGRRTLTHFAARFDGMLQVTDSDALREAVQAGIGPAKSLGFGLFSLARPS